MKLVHSIDIQSDNMEEILPGFSEEFPYIASCVELDRYPTLGSPWHWHKAVELFYVEKGCLEYTTPHGKWVFPEGSGGMVNANVLHTSRVSSADTSTVQLLHIFDPVLLSGMHGNRMETKYILPVTSATAVEMIALNGKNTVHNIVLQAIRKSFDISEQEWGYEFRLREILTNIWLKLYAMERPKLEEDAGSHKVDSQMKTMMLYIREHYTEPISVDQLAEAAHISKRVCFRIFQEVLHMSPVEYMREYRLQKACEMLTGSNESITQIAVDCGMGTSSYFGKVFAESYGCTPTAYRRKWRDPDKNGHE